MTVDWSSLEGNCEQEPKSLGLTRLGWEFMGEQTQLNRELDKLVGVESRVAIADAAEFVQQFGFADLLEIADLGDVELEFIRQRASFISKWQEKLIGAGQGKPRTAEAAGDREYLKAYRTEEVQCTLAEAGVVLKEVA